MKEVYDIDTGEIKYAYPSRRDPGVYETPQRTTSVVPPSYNPEKEFIRFRESQWRIYSKSDSRHFRVIEDQNLDALQLLREERNKRLQKIDTIFQRYEEQGLTVPSQWIDYRADLRNVPQHVEFGLVDPPQIVSGKLVFHEWPEPPKS